MPHRISFRWSQSSNGANEDDSQGLAKRLSAVAEDQAADAQEVVRECATLLRRWVKERPYSWGKNPGQAGAELEAGIEGWIERQAWRGSCANFVQALRGAFVSLKDEAELRTHLVDEMTAWTTTGLEFGGPMPEPQLVSQHALRHLTRGEEVLIHGRSNVLLEALTRAQQAGLSPRVTVAINAPDQGGKLIARHLSSQGVAVRLVWDSALIACVAAADQVWLAAEGLGPAAFIGALGGASVLSEARRLEIPTTVLCTTDACLPGGEMRLPAWGDEEQWQLWSQGPEGVTLEAQPFEIIDASSVTRWITDEGHTTLGDLCVRHQRDGEAPSCGSTYPIKNEQDSLGRPGLTTTLSDDR
jgi:translation initiation factor 2B subunit (eIF-2B alpha/beta/delta family)